MKENETFYERVWENARELHLEGEKRPVEIIGDTLALILLLPFAVVVIFSGAVVGVFKRIFKMIRRKS